MVGHFAAELYTRLVPHRTLLLGSTLAFILFCAGLSTQFTVREDIRALIPNHPPELQTDFHLLSAAPFMQFTTITIGGPTIDPIPLLRQVSKQLGPPAFNHVYSSLIPAPTPDKLATALDYLPSLLPTQTYESLLPELLTNNEVALRENAHALHTLQGIFLHQIIAKDPYNFRSLLAKQWQNILPKNHFSTQNGYALTADGHYGMLIAKAAFPMSDSVGAATAMEAVRSSLKTLPEGVDAFVTGGHRHTEENAAIIKADISRVVPFSLLVLAGLFIFFIRSVHGVFLFLLPMAALAIATACTGALFGHLSGIVLGFGGVLLGITTDYAVHSYYAIAEEPESPTAALAHLAHPLGLSALTTITAFAVLTSSTIDVIAELSFFTISGLCFAFILALMVLPHCFARRPSMSTKTNRAPLPPAPPPSPVLSGKRLCYAWAVVVAIGIIAAQELTLSGDIRQLGYTSEATRKDEAVTQALWGGLGQGTLVVSSGASLEETLKKNDAVALTLTAAQAHTSFLSLAFFLPSQATQQERHGAWKKFWENQGEQTIAALTKNSQLTGFTPDAFLPFRKLLQTPPPFVTQETLANFGLSPLIEMLLLPTVTGYTAYTLVEGASPLSGALSGQLEKLGTRVLSNGYFTHALAEASQQDILRFGCLVLLAVAGLTWYGLRKPKAVALALLPSGASLAAVLVVFRLAGGHVSLFHIIALPLVMGLSVDYGIFMVCRHHSPRQQHTRKAIALSALSTTATFGCLILARHPVLLSIGTTVFYGMLCSMLVALFVIPRLEEQRGKPQ